MGGDQSKEHRDGGGKAHDDDSDNRDNRNKDRDRHRENRDRNDRDRNGGDGRDKNDRTRDNKDDDDNNNMSKATESGETDGTRGDETSVMDGAVADDMAGTAGAGAGKDESSQDDVEESVGVGATGDAQAAAAAAAAGDSAATNGYAVAGDRGESDDAVAAGQMSGKGPDIIPGTSAALGTQGEGKDKAADTNDAELKAPVLSNEDAKADTSGIARDGESGGEPEGSASPPATVMARAFGLAVRSGLVGPNDLGTLSAVSVETCALSRENHKSHVKVTADTPLYVWSMTRSRQAVVAEESKGDESDAAAVGQTADVARGLPPPPPAGLGTTTELSSAMVSRVQRVAHEARRRSQGYVDRERRRQNRVAPLRISHITWDRNDEDLRLEFARELPSDLEKVTFGFGFNVNVDGVKVEWPAGMKTIHFGLAFNPRPAALASAPARGRVDANERGGRGRGGRGAAESGSGGGKWAEFLPSGLEELVFGGHFNQPLGGVKWPPGLKRLVFGPNFTNAKQDMACAEWPENLEEVTFGAYFNQPIDGVKWPASLRKLTFGTGFNQPVEKCRFNKGLEEITFGAHFNSPVEATRWPQNLKCLTFGERFNKPVSATMWPPGVTRLAFGRAFDQTLDGPTWPPAALEVLVVGSRFKGKEAVNGDEERGFSVTRKASPSATRRKSVRRVGSSKSVEGGGEGTIERRRSAINPRNVSPPPSAVANGVGKKGLGAAPSRRLSPNGPIMSARGNSVRRAAAAAAPASSTRILFPGKAADKVTGDKPAAAAAATNISAQKGATAADAAATHDNERNGSDKQDAITQQQLEQEQQQEGEEPKVVEETAPEPTLSTETSQTSLVVENGDEAPEPREDSSAKSGTPDGDSTQSQAVDERDAEVAGAGEAGGAPAVDGNEDGVAPVAVAVAPKAGKVVVESANDHGGDESAPKI